MTIRELIKELRAIEKDSGNLDITIMKDGEKIPFQKDFLSENLDGELCLLDFRVDSEFRITIW